MESTIKRVLHGKKRGAPGMSRRKVQAHLIFICTGWVDFWQFPDVGMPLLLWHFAFGVVTQLTDEGSGKVIRTGGNLSLTRFVMA